MEQVKVTYSVNKEAAIRAGLSEYGAVVQAVDVAELTPEQREALLACPIGGENAYNLTGNIRGMWDDHCRELLTVAEPGPEVPVRLLDARLEIKRRREHEAAQALDEKRSALLAKTDKELTNHGQGVKLRVLSEAVYVARKFPDDAEVQAKIQAAQAFCDEQNPLLEAEEQRRQEELKRKEKALIDAQDAWITNHGSDLLKARREGDYEWEDLAKKEYLNHALTVAGLPLGIKQDSDWFTKRDYPTLEEIEAARKVREALVTDGHDVLRSRLVWLQAYGSDYYTDEGPEVRPYAGAQAGIELDVETPFGTAYRLLLVKEITGSEQPDQAAQEDGQEATEGGEDA